MTRTHQLEATLRKLKLGACSTPWTPAWPRPAPASLATWSSARSCARTRSTAARPRHRGSGVRRARFEEPTTLEDFDFAFNPKLPTAPIRDLATCRFIQAGESVIL